MRRRLLNLLTALSLLLCVAVVVLWGRSYAWSDHVTWQRSRLSGPRQHQVVDSLFGAEGLLIFTRDTKRAEDETTPGEDSQPLFEPSARADGMHYGCFSPQSMLDNLHDSGYWPRFGFLAEEQGFGFGPHDGTWYTVVTIPFWAAFTLSALLPAARLSSFMRRRLRSKQHLCPACGYNLTANVSGVCPECGRRSERARIESCHQPKGSHDK